MNTQNTRAKYQAPGLKFSAFAIFLQRWLHQGAA